MLTDYHTHSYRCGHATGRMEEYIERAIELGIDEIGLTDHLYLYFIDPAHRNPGWAMAEGEFAAHYEEMLRLRDQFDGRIQVRISLEADYVEGHEEALRKILARYEFDFVLLGVHFVDGWLIDDPAEVGRYDQIDVTDLYRRYFRCLQQAVKLDLFDVVAHFDLPKKFGFRPAENLDEEIAETLDLIRSHDLAVEVSTAGLRKPVGEIYPSAGILNQMRRRSIPIVLSSDAHRPGEVGADYEVALKLIGESGYDSIARFEKRRREERRLERAGVQPMESN